MSEDVSESKAEAATNRADGEPSSSEAGQATPNTETAGEESAPASAADAGEDAEAVRDEVDPLVLAQEESKRYKDQLLRTAADFDNFRKRSKREISEATERGREALLKELLPVFDNLERASDHAKTATDVAALSDGIGMVMKQFVDTLARLGIEKVDAVGEPFDPALHEAIQQLETADVPPGTVAHQVQPGYKLGDRLVRPCMVVVAKAPSE